VIKRLSKSYVAVIPFLQQPFSCLCLRNEWFLVSKPNHGLLQNTYVRRSKLPDTIYDAWGVHSRNCLAVISSQLCMSWNVIWSFVIWISIVTAAGMAFVGTAWHIEGRSRQINALHGWRKNWMGIESIFLTRIALYSFICGILSMFR
jgi:hypothetical protein